MKWFTCVLVFALGLAWSGPAMATKWNLRKPLVSGRRLVKKAVLLSTALLVLGGCAAVSVPDGKAPAPPMGKPTIEHHIQNLCSPPGLAPNPKPVKTKEMSQSAHDKKLAKWKEANNPRYRLTEQQFQAITGYFLNDQSFHGRNNYAAAFKEGTREVEKGKSFLGTLQMKDLVPVNDPALGSLGKELHDGMRLLAAASPKKANKYLKEVTHLLALPEFAKDTQLGNVQWVTSIWRASKGLPKVEDATGDFRSVLLVLPNVDHMLKKTKAGKKGDLGDRQLHVAVWDVLAKAVEMDLQYNPWTKKYPKASRERRANKQAKTHGIVGDVVRDYLLASTDPHSQVSALLAQGDIKPLNVDHLQLAMNRVISHGYDASIPTAQHYLEATHRDDKGPQLVHTSFQGDNRMVKRVVTRREFNRMGKEATASTKTKWLNGDQRTEILEKAILPAARVLLENAHLPEVQRYLWKDAKKLSRSDRDKVHALIESGVTMDGKGFSQLPIDLTYKDKTFELRGGKWERVESE